MARGKGRSAAASVAAQQKQREAQQPDVHDDWVEPIAGERGRGTRVVQEGDQLTLIVPRAGEPERHDLTFLFRVPELMALLAEGIKRYSETDVKAKSRHTTISTLNRYFVKYVVYCAGTYQTPLALCDAGFWTSFIEFLNRPDESGEPFAISTRVNALQAVRAVVRGAEAAPEWQNIASRIREHLPKNPWPGQERKSGPTPVIPLDHFDAIVLAADREFAELRDRWDEGQQLLAEGQKRLSSSSGDFRKDKALCIAALDVRYNGFLPTVEQIKKDDKRLGNSVQHYHGKIHLASYFHLYARDVVPLVLLLAARTSFNPDVILPLEWSDLEQIQGVDGRNMIHFVPYKPRSGHTQSKHCDPEPEATDGLNGLLELIENMTARLRPSVSQRYHERLFLFKTENKTPTPKGFDKDYDSHASDTVWWYNLARFITDNNLRQFTLDTFRPTRGSEIMLTTGDVNLARDELGHRSTRTTWTHYTSDEVRRRQMERVGQVYLVRERWRETNGRIDPRGRQVDAGAATPGFICMNPNDSPRPGQVKGRPCQAYGECADCPLAAVVNDVTPAAQYLAVREAIVAAQQTVAAQTWYRKWAPILEAHDAMLAALDPDVVERAKFIRLKYPAVG